MILYATGLTQLAHKKKIMKIISILIVNTFELFSLIVSKKEINLDTPEPWGVFFQDNATPQMEGLEELHNNIMFYLAIILFAVT